MPSKEARELYEAPLALIRPDQIIAWRGFDDVNGDAVTAVALGHPGNHGTR